MTPFDASDVTGGPRAHSARDRADRTRRSLLDATAALINRGDATVQNIQSRAGVSRGAMYGQFDSKTDLVHALLADAAQRLPTASSTGDDGAHGVVRGFLDLVCADAVVHASCVLWSDAQFAPAAREATRHLLHNRVLAALHPDRDQPSHRAVVTTDLVIAVITAHTATPGSGLTDPSTRAAVDRLMTAVLL